MVSTCIVLACFALDACATLCLPENILAVPSLLAHASMCKFASRRCMQASQRLRCMLSTCSEPVMLAMCPKALIGLVWCSVAACPCTRVQTRTPIAYNREKTTFSIHVSPHSIHYSFSYGCVYMRNNVVVEYFNAGTSLPPSSSPASLSPTTQNYGWAKRVHT